MRGRLREEIERSYSKWNTSARIAQANGPGPGQTHGASAHENAYDWEYPDWSIFEIVAGTCRTSRKIP